MTPQALTAGEISANIPILLSTQQSSERQMKAYQPAPKHVSERLQIAIICGESFVLQWAEENSDAVHMSKVSPLEVLERNGRQYLRAQNDEHVDVMIRLDLIRNLPTPSK